MTSDDTWLRSEAFWFVYYWSFTPAGSFAFHKGWRQWWFYSVLLWNTKPIKIWHWKWLALVCARGMKSQPECCRIMMTKDLYCFGWLEIQKLFFNVSVLLGLGLHALCDEAGRRAEPAVPGNAVSMRKHEDLIMRQFVLFMLKENPGRTATYLLCDLWAALCKLNWCYHVTEHGHSMNVTWLRWLFRLWTM